MSKTCLIIDDSSVIRNVAERIIADFGTTSLHAEDAATALAICAEQTPDVTIVDWNLVDDDSLELIKQMRACESEDKKSFIIYLTSEFDVPSMTKAKRAGADAFALKPFHSESLKAKWIEFGLAA